MKKAFSFIELMIVIAIIFILVMIGINQTKNNKNNLTLGPEKPIYPNISQRFTLEGHSYMVINISIYTGGSTTIHDPDCPKCHPMKVEVEKR